jgi:hypothetical protein
MTADKYDTLPDELLETLDGSRLEQRTELVFELFTVSAEGWPHVALLSVGEVLALEDSLVMLALWSNSTTTANLRAGSKAVLQLFHGAAYRVRLECAAVDNELAAEARLALFRGRVVSVVRDAVGYATLTSGPRISLADPAKVIERWKTTVELMRTAAAG